MTIERTILVINAGWEQWPLLAAARRACSRLVAVHASPDVRSDLGIDRLEVADFRDTARILKIAHEEQVDAVVTDACDYSAYSAALVAEVLGLPGIGIRAASRTTNKALQRVAVAAAGVPQPKHAAGASIEDARHAAEAVGYPLIVKPVDSRGGLGVRVVKREEDLQAAVIHAIGNSISWQFMIEEFIEGTQVVVDGYVFPRSGYQPLVISSKRMVADSHTATDYISPPEISPRHRDALKSYDARIVDALGIKFGMTHGEYMIDDKGRVHLIEIANRSGGVWIGAKYDPAVSGIDTTEQLVEDALDSGRDLFQERGGPANHLGRIHFLIPPIGKTLSAIRGTEHARALPGVAGFWANDVKGLRVDAYDSDLIRQGFAIISAETQEELDNLVEQIQQIISFQTEGVE